METARQLCEIFCELYAPRHSFVVFTGRSASKGQYTKLFFDDQCRLIRLMPSEGAAAAEAAMKDSSLRALFHQAVFDSRMDIDECERASHLSALVSQMLPGRHKTVIVTERDGEDPVVIGAHKGKASFNEPEFGTKVLIVLS